MQRAAIGSVAELEKFVDDYIAYTGSRAELKQLHDDAVRAAPEIFARRLDVEEAEEVERSKQRRMGNTIAHMQVRPPLVMQQRAAVGEIAIPIATAVDSIAKLVPVAGELLIAAEVITGKTHAGLGFDIPASERALSAALLLGPFAVQGLASGVRGAAQLLRLSRALGKTTEETRRLLTAVRTLESSEPVIREALAAKKAGQPLTAAQSAALRAGDEALLQIRGAAAQSKFDIRNPYNLAVKSFAPNPNNAVRNLSEARAIAAKNGIEIPPWIEIVIDPTVRESRNYAVYELVKDAKDTGVYKWAELGNNGRVVVRVHPNVFASDEKIVGVFQHEIWELTQLRTRIDTKGALTVDEIQKLIATDKEGLNLHSQAWEVADLRIMIMRERDAERRAQMVTRLGTLIKKYQEMNLR